MAVILGATFNTHAQTAVVGNSNSNLSLVQAAAPDSIVQITADAQGLPLVSPGQAPVPISGAFAFWWILPSGIAVPAPCPPQNDLTVPIYQMAQNQWLVDMSGGVVPTISRRSRMQAQIAGGTAVSPLETEATMVADLILRVQSAAAIQQMGMMSLAMGMNASSGPVLGADGGGGADTNSVPFFGISYTPPTNGLWLEITNVSNGCAWLNLHNATNHVYEILSKTDLSAAAWNIEQELWPADTNCQPFTIPVLDRTNTLFVWARDWTGVTSGGNQTPEWFFWKYYGTVNLSDNDLDSEGNPLLFDYQNGFDPNVIQFTLRAGSRYVNTPWVSPQTSVSAGIPFYETVLVNDTNLADAVWQPYTSSNFMVNLGPMDGLYNVQVGLRGLPPNARQTWAGLQILLDTTPPVLAITNPPTATVSKPLIQVQGLVNEFLSSLTFDVSNAAGLFTNQTGYTSPLFYDTNLFEFTTSAFQCYNVTLTNGLNTITLHATDLAGNVTMSNFNVTLDYSGDTTPALTVIWPQDGSSICGNSFTFEGQVDDITATVTATIVNSNSNTNVVQGLVEQNGTVWVQNLPLALGANTLTITAADAAGNASTNSLTLNQSSVTVTMDPLSGNQFNQPSVTVTGTVSDPTMTVAVNGVETYYVDDAGDWEADGVPVSPTGTAIFNVEVYSGQMAMMKSHLMRANDSSSGSNAGSEQFTMPQPAFVTLANYTLDNYNYGDGWGVWKLHWNYANGGSWSADFSDPYPSGSGSGTIFSVGTNYTLPTVDILYNLTTLDGPKQSEWSGIFSPLWQSSYTAFNLDDVACQSFVQTTLMIVPSGFQLPTVPKTYLVRMSAMSFSDPFDDQSIWGLTSLFYPLSGDTPVPPEWLQINSQTLVNTGVTNEDDGSTWGETIVSGPAGANVNLTPTATQSYQGWDYTFDAQALDVTHILAVDNNRDGQITFDDNDGTTATKPFRFWINDSQEQGDDESASGAGGADDQIPGQYYFKANYSLTHVNGRSDLINFFPVGLCLSNVMQWLPFTNGWEYHLSQNDPGPPPGLGRGAVKFVYTSLSPTNAFDYLTNTASYGYGTNCNEWAPNADTIQVMNTQNTPGTVLDTNWLAQVQANGGYGVILVEGCAAVTQPLTLEFWHTDQNGNKTLMGGVPLYLRITGVEQMFRCLNLCNFGNGTPDSLAGSRNTITNEPTTNGKNLVFVHGYNVNQQEARGVESEMFKRFYWSGSKAKFYGVTWNGAESQITAASFTPNYHTNVVNALDTAQAFATFIGSLSVSGPTVVAAHSLGNMVVLSAISDYGATPSHYFMIDAAVPIEAVQSDATPDSNMIYPDWLSPQVYGTNLYASHWWQLFPANDARNTLTWQNRLGNLGSVDIYNFYSSGEEVLREFTGGTPPTEASVSESQLAYWFENWSTWFQDIYGSVLPVGTYVWQWQEMLKGRGGSDEWIGSKHGGWSFNYLSYGSYINDIWVNLASAQAALLTTNELRTNAFFDVTSSFIDQTINPSDTTDLALYGSGGSAYAAANRNRILSDAIPALTLPIGANYVTNLDVILGGTANFDMQANFENGWPLSRLASGEQNNNWHHSDFDYVAYLYTYQLFSAIVNIGNLH